MKLIYRLPVLCACLSFLVLGCNERFEEINTDPNKTTVINPGSLLSPAIYSGVTRGLNSFKGFTDNLMQFAVPVESFSDGVHRYVLVSTVGSGLWSNYYSSMTNIEDIISSADKLNDRNYKAIGLIIRAWRTSIMTDAFGDIPYSEANKGEEGILQPAFDTQESIYKSILDDLKTANDLFELARPLRFGGDILYFANNANNLIKWKRFCNSLRLRLLLRTMDKIDWAKDEIVEIISNPGDCPVFLSAADDAILRFTNVSPNDNPFLSSRFRDFSEANVYTTFFIETLESLNDPRLKAWSTQSKVKDSPTGYDGVQSAYPESLTIRAAEFSSYHGSLQSSPLIGAIITYAEVEYIKAELALKGIIPSDARTHYENAVKASFARWEMAMPTGYLEAGPAVYNGTLEQIMLQKYLNYYFIDMQCWFEKMRTGFPDFPVGPAAKNNGIMPSRLPYPPSVSIYNEANYKKAIEKLGGTDDINKRVWWNE
jgi:hypothetical protein